MVVGYHLEQGTRTGAMVARSMPGAWHEGDFTIMNGEGVYKEMVTI